MPTMTRDHRREHVIRADDTSRHRETSWRAAHCRARASDQNSVGYQMPVVDTISGTAVIHLNVQQTG
ncbi:hypothetical protein M1247_30245 [Mycobacterium sp. 21AC1]|uniref:hypothetical protein n=1 Tax=[Mycobacterium] appelbergii TaxID=2939269 RepID=UPI0029394941|nr:hypothetical protein [Mycobacterium sp. 21AC1]MDV3129219.1 hypothetical protein [Mycobacterium sp. 21AC1]